MATSKIVWIRVGRVVAALVLVGLGVYLFHVGPDAADKLGSSIGLLVALAALLTPYLIPAPSSSIVSVADVTRVEETGNATARAGGQANTGVMEPTHRGRTMVKRSGDAKAEGPGSLANTGVRRVPTESP